MVPALARDIQIRLPKRNLELGMNYGTLSWDKSIRNIVQEKYKNYLNDSILRSANI
jgi:hypothetical protein